MANLSGLASFVSELRVERTNLVDRLRHVDAAVPKPKRTISAAGKKRIAAAQRARWAKVKARQKKAS